MSNIPFSANSILILKLNEFKYLPLGPLKNYRSASLKDVLVSMANFVTNASRVRVVQKSTARDISLFTLFNILLSCGGPIRKLTFFKIRPSLYQSRQPQVQLYVDTSKENFINITKNIPF